MSGGERFYARLVDRLLPQLDPDDRELLLESFRWMRREAERRQRLLYRPMFWTRMTTDLVLLALRELCGIGVRGGTMQDLIQGWRALRRAPRTTATAVFTLALGIGGTTAMFSIVDGVMLSPLPYPEPDRIVSIWERSEEAESQSTSYLNFRDWRAGSRTVRAMAGFVSARPMTVLTPSGGVRAGVSSVTADFFQVIGTAPVLGRVFSAEENRDGGPPVAVVSESLWSRTLGGTADLSGARLNIDGEAYSVVGVLPSEADFPEGADIWLPLERAVPWSIRGNHVLRVVGRLEEGVDVLAADRELDAIQARLAERYPEVEAPGAVVRSLKDEVLGNSRRALVILLLASGLLTLVACTNVASTLLARGLGRRRELAIRASVGADRRRLVRQLLGESAILGLLGAAAGIAVARGLVWLARTTDAGSVPRLGEVGLNARVLLFAAGFGLLSSIVFGLLPSLRLTVGRLSGNLRSKPTGGSDREVRRSWRIMAGAEVALATLLLVGAGMTARSLSQILTRDNGIRTDGVVTATLHFPRSEYDLERGLAYIDGLIERMEAERAVTGAGTTLLLPVAGSGAIAGPVEPEGRERTDGVYSYQVAHPGYFEALGIPLLRGRMFDRTDGPGSPHVAVVDEAMAALLWPGEDPVGKRFNVGGMDPYREQDITVIGVVPEVRHWRQDPGDNPTYYLSYRQRPAFYGFIGVQVVASGPEPGRVAELLRSTATGLDPDVPLQVRTLESMVAGSAATQRFAGTVLAAFAVVALLLAALGLYSVIGYTVAQRTREIGIRLALGAEASGIFRQVLGEAFLIALVGVGVGLGAAAGLGRLLDPILFSVSTVDPLSYGAAATVLLAAALFAGWWPARRTLRVDPAVTLSAE